MLGGCDYDSQASIASTTNFDNESVRRGQVVVEPQPITSEDPLDQKINTIVAELSLEQRVAQLFVIHPESIVDAGVVVQAGSQTQEAFKRWPVGGIVYFGQNLNDEGQTKAMLANVMRFGLESNGIPPFLCVDEEGGTVSRIGGTTGFDAHNVGDMADIGATNDSNQAKDIAIYIANYLKPLGFNVNFAPVCDIANNPSSDTMRQRSFGADPELVARMTAAWVEGFLEAGVLCCAKHFPGIGAAIGDSHDIGITTLQTIEGLLESELLPFRAAIQVGVPFIMVGHIAVPAVTGSDVPASLSPEIVQKLLREEMGYEGLIVTDSLGMGAIHEQYGVADSAVLALKAGCDIVLMPADFEVALGSILDVVKSGELGEERIDQSLRRILRTKLNYLGNFLG